MKILAMLVLPVLLIVNQFVLNTVMLSPEELEMRGLLSDDIQIDAAAGCYDHLPMVVDFALAAWE